MNSAYKALLHNFVVPEDLTLITILAFIKIQFANGIIIFLFFLLLRDGVVLTVTCQVSNVDVAFVAIIFSIGGILVDNHFLKLNFLVKQTSKEYLALNTMAILDIEK
ncbi:hypothetical protein GQX74_009920 [Glossina fuscipes]|nr:hypothetical protein GQX74_009920 [Glossina fuscipes]